MARDLIGCPELLSYVCRCTTSSDLGHIPGADSRISHSPRFFTFISFASRGCHEWLPVATMGRSSPPFLYESPTAYSFKGPTDRGFNPRAATEASWTRPADRPKQKGPLVNLNRHPDTVCAIFSEINGGFC
jgi:hypothetical protein